MRKVGERLQKSVQEIRGELLVSVSLRSTGLRQRSPPFRPSICSDHAVRLYEQFVAKLRQSGIRVETGHAIMQVSIQNDGPVTPLLEREATARQVSS